MALTELLRNISPVNEDEVDDIDLPGFLLRAMGKVNPGLPEDDNWTQMMMKGKLPPRQKRKKWKVKEPEYRLWRKNAIDERLIYNMTEAQLSPSHGRAVRLSALTREAALLVDRSQWERENHLIHGPDRLPDRPSLGRHLTSMYKLPRPGPALPYSEPESAQRQLTLNRTHGDHHRMAEPHVVKIDPSGVPCVPCEDPSLACKILGSTACARCISQTNRRLTSRLEAVVLPRMDSSVVALVAPRAARSMGLERPARIPPPHEVFADDPLLQLTRKQRRRRRRSKRK